MNIEIDGYNICYKISGSGEKTAVILQGWGTDLGVYDSVAEAINDGYRVVQFDFPGFGGSDEPREGWNVDAFADIPSEAVLLSYWQQERNFPLRLRILY